MLFADDMDLAANSKEELRTELERWRQAPEEAGLRISRDKTGTLRIRTEDVGRAVLHGEALPDKGGPMVSGKRGCEADVKHRVGCGCLAWRSLTGVLCGRKIHSRHKGKTQKTVIRPKIMYGSETWPATKRGMDILATTEMKAPRWGEGIALREQAPNTTTRGRFEVMPIPRKVVGNLLRWYGHVQRRGEDYCGKVEARIIAPGKTTPGRPRGRGWRR